MKAIILFGHGARDPRWREPFDRLVELWFSRYPAVPVKLAFGDHAAIIRRGYGIFSQHCSHSNYCGASFL